jgi:hypothetical protein
MGRRHHTDRDCDDDYEHGFIHSLLWPVRTLWSMFKGAMICVIWIVIIFGGIWACSGSGKTTAQQSQPTAPICK